MVLTIISIILALLEALAIGYLYLQNKKIQTERSFISKNLNKKNFEELIIKEFKNQESLKKDFNKISNDLDKFKAYSKTNFNKIGFKRYNPFETVGGDQSFTLALLNSNNDGVVLSSLHQRDVNRVYAKLIKVGKPSHKLSKEETEVLNTVLKNK